MEKNLGRKLKDEDVVVDFTHPENMKAIDNVWKISFLKGNAHESTGWATQKPLSLYERIVLASSNPGDIVFDPFAGCSTTLVAAEKHGRLWVGCDVDPTAETVVRQRLMDSRQLADTVAKVQLLTKSPLRNEPSMAQIPNLAPRPVQPRPPRLPRSQVLAALVQRDGMICQGCGFEPPWEDFLEIDHQQPKSEGGSDAVDNRILLCSPCNRTKSDRLTLKGLRVENQRKHRIVQKFW